MAPALHFAQGMRRPIEVVFTILTIAVACGGQVQGTHGGDCSASCAKGDTCSMPIATCNGQTTSVTCSCENGSFACPDIGGSCPPEPPNPGECTGVMNGASCTREGHRCPNFTNPKCGGVIYPCTCTSGRWSCPVEKCPPCPDASSIHSGFSCGGGGPMSCPGTDSCGNVTQCFCMGPTWTWCCSSNCVDGGPPDAKPD